MAARDDTGYGGHRREGGHERGREGGPRLGDGGSDTEESFNCPIGSECNRQKGLPVNSNES